MVTVSVSGVELVCGDYGATWTLVTNGAEDACVSQCDVGYCCLGRNCCWLELCERRQCGRAVSGRKDKGPAAGREVVVLPDDEDTDV
jgi:hypothetical protein